MNLKVGPKAIKISLIQTLPGRETDVVVKLNEACDRLNVVNRSILKGLGSFDIVLIYEWNDYSSILTQAGPIDGVLKTSRSFAFHYGGNDDFFKIINSSAFTAISLAKVDFERDDANSYENEIVESISMKSDSVKRFVLGTLGWNEIICVLISNSLNELVDCLMWSTEDDYKHKISKTLSFLSINYNQILPTKERSKNRFNLSGQNCLNLEIDAKITPTIAITCLPRFSEYICAFWEKKQYIIFDSFGSHDLIVLPGTTLSWAQLLEDLLNFRENYSEYILSTKTEISQKKIVSNIAPPFKQNQNLKKIVYDYKFLVDSFGPKASLLAGSINTFKGLLHNPVIGDAFADMAEYPQYIFEKGPLFSERDEKQNFASQTADLLKAGAELRLYGTHGTLSENVGQFTKLRGGIHRSLMAIEHIPYLAMERATSGVVPWRGFVISTSPQFANYNDVISVPNEALFDPSLWWAVYHESGHLIVNNLQGFIDENIVELKYFLEDKKDKRLWLSLLAELASEYIGFALGFYEDYALYVKKLWTYINDLLKKQNYLAPLSTYAVRTYFVEIFDRHFFGKEEERASFDINDHDVVYRGIIRHIESIRECLGEKINPIILSQVYNDRHFIAAYYCTRFKKLYPWFQKKLYDKVDKLGIRTKITTIDQYNTCEVFESIKNGIVYNGNINRPEAVLYKFLCQDEPNFSQKKALILSFGNMHRFTLARGRV